MDAFKSIMMTSIQRFKDDLEFTINWCREHGLLVSEMVCVHCGMECYEGIYARCCLIVGNRSKMAIFYSHTTAIFIAPHIKKQIFGILHDYTHV